MRTDTPKTIYLKDYKPPPQHVTHVDMVVKLHATRTVVETTLHVQVDVADQHFVLNGEGLKLKSVAINGKMFKNYVYDNDALTLEKVPADNFTLSIVQQCNPKANSALSGLYLSNNMFCTQMEAEGFRRFAFMQDQPDVMATYSVRIEAPKTLPVLLSNGNPGERGDIASSEGHFAMWHDPHPKPTYLFALVAGDLASVHDHFKTNEGRDVSLGIYVEKGKEDRCAWAMESLKTSMRWDEERFGRAYDLDVFNIVAVSDFNMGAMENKGLNIFNDKYILARPDTATDIDHVNIERIIAHEYFHNWTGNRITCRDWFQLCLKEGLTVFRDQEFTSDLRSRAVKRIEDVKTLRARQFPEDQGPLAHPVRPSSYIEINNFYTPTVYEKGAEVCRMLHTLVGRDAFRKAMDIYFARHDGEAATIEHFLTCFAETSGRDLSHFAKWYEQAGTPVVDVTTAYDATMLEFTVNIEQSTPDTPGQMNKPPLHLPLQLGLIGKDGRDLPLQTLENVVLHDSVFEMTTARSSLTFRNIPSRPVLSINRAFSAPVILKTDATDHDLLTQMAQDSDTFSQWEAAQTCARRLLLRRYQDEHVTTDRFADGLAATLADPSRDNAFKALMLQLPGEAEIAATLSRDVDAEKLHDVRHAVLTSVARQLAPELEHCLSDTKEAGAYAPDTASVGRRSLHLTSLGLLAYAMPEKALELAKRMFDAADNMTLESGALAAVLAIDHPGVDSLLQTFFDRHANDHLLVDKWLMLMAARPAKKPAARIKTLTKHSAFSFKTPNKVYALIGGFTAGNLAGFHAVDGSGYKLIADCIVKLDGINPQVAARMATSFRSWKLYDTPRREHARAEMQRVLATKGLSKDVFEIISRTCA
jgi:aminopeptidase N